MMNQYDKFAVNHTSFEKSIRESFHEMLQDQNHTDVTLAADDGNPIHAHQIVLSAGSKFFSDVFKRSRHTSPYIYLRGFKHPPPPDPRLLYGMPKIHAHYVENESKMLKITRYPLPPEISGSTPDAGIY